MPQCMHSTVSRSLPTHFDRRLRTWLALVSTFERRSIRLGCILSILHVVSLHVRLHFGVLAYPLTCFVIGKNVLLVIGGPV